MKWALRAKRGCAGWRRTMGVTALVLPATPALGQTPVPMPPVLQAPWRAFNAGDNPTKGPSHIAYADLNGDGHVDIVLARHQFGQPGMSVLFGGGDGTFAPPALYNLPFNHSVHEVALVDIDGDGDLDVLGTAGGPLGDKDRVALWRNTGNGLFSAAILLPTGLGPVGLAVGDFTGDGFPDIITANHGWIGDRNTISLLRHNGQTGAAANFLAPVHTIVATDVYRVAAADIDGDGDLDLAVSRKVTFGGHVAIVYNTGAGVFSAPTLLPAVPVLHASDPAIHFADIDGDGDMDLVASGHQQGTPTRGFVAVYRNNGNGEFAAPQIHYLPGGTFRVNSVRTADLNGDGFPDIIATTPSGRSADGWCVLLSNGAGNFHPATWYGASKDTWDALGLDVDGNGTIDVLTVANDSSLLTVHRNPPAAGGPGGAGTGVFPKLTRYITGGLTNGAAAADIDGDGDIDIVTCDGYATTGGAVRILRNNGDGSLAAMETYAHTPFWPGMVLLRDMNNDGLPDLLMGPRSEQPPYRVAIALNQGNGVFGAPFVLNPNGCQAGDIDTADFDNDGYLDIVLNEPGTCPGGGFVSHLFLIRNNIGSGGPAMFSLMTPVTGNYGYGVGAGDFNGDGFMDIANTTPTGIGIVLGNGNFSFQPPIIAATGEGAHPFAVADVDGDGHLDIVYRSFTVSYSSGIDSVGLVRGMGNGSMHPPQIYHIGNHLENMQYLSKINTADINHDGRMDVLLTSNTAGDVTILYGRAQGPTPSTTLDPRYDRYGAGYDASHTMVADFNLDGRLDVATVLAFTPDGPSSAVVVLKGVVQAPTCYANCDGSTTPPVLNVADFGCFLQKFAAGDAYANCDGSTTPPVLNVADFGCFLQQFAAGCR